MLQYITLVLDQWEKEANQNRPGLSDTRDFQYPPVLPIVFYDGAAPWTAERNFVRRTALNKVFAKYIPSFEYELVDLNAYAEEDLFQFQDVLSLVLLIDKIRTREGLSLLGSLPEGYVETLGLNIPPGMNKLISDVITVLLDRLEVPEEEIAAVTDHIERKEYQTMFDALVENVLADRRMAREEGLAEGIQIGVERTREEDQERAYREKLESARKLKAGGVPVQTIAESLTLSVDAVKSL
jgi:hypothetical protein